MTVADEPSLGEVVRHLHRIEAQLSDLGVRVVGVDLYARDQREIERRFAALERDAEQIQGRVEGLSAASGTNLRQAIYSGLIPAGLFIVSTLVTVLLALRGGP